MSKIYSNPNLHEYATKGSCYVNRMSSYAWDDLKTGSQWILDGTYEFYYASGYFTWWSTRLTYTNRLIAYKAPDGNYSLLGNGVINVQYTYSPTKYGSMSIRSDKNKNMPSVGDITISASVNIPRTTDSYNRPQYYFSVFGGTNLDYNCIDNFSENKTNVLYVDNVQRSYYMGTTIAMNTDISHVKLSSYETSVQMPEVLQDVTPFDYTADWITLANKCYNDSWLNPDYKSAPSINRVFYPTVNNLYYTTNLTHAIDYVNNGTVYDDFNVNSVDDTGYKPTSTPDGGDSGDENGDSGHTTDDNDVNVPTTSALSLQDANLYSLNANTLKSFDSWFSSYDISSILDNLVTGKYNNLTSCVLSVMDMPVEQQYLGATTESHIIVGSVDTGLTAPSYSGEPKIRTLGSIEIKEHYGSYLDYSPYTDLQLYLPYVGFFLIDTNLFMDTTLTVKCMYDVITGKITYYILCNNVITYIKEGVLATPFEISLEDSVGYRSGLVTSLASKSTNLALSASTGDVGATASSACNFFGGMQPPHIDMSGVATDSSGLFAPQKCYLMRKIPSYNRPDNYGARIGYPCFKKYKLSSVSGFTQCQNPYINISLASETENKMIEDLLTKGVVI